MSSAEKVLADGLKLPVAERLRVAADLWNSLPENLQREYDEAEFWEEIKRRNADLDKGLVQPLTHEEVMASAREAIKWLSATTPESVTK